MLALNRARSPGNKQLEAGSSRFSGWWIKLPASRGLSVCARPPRALAPFPARLPLAALCPGAPVPLILKTPPNLGKTPEEQKQQAPRVLALLWDLESPPPPPPRPSPHARPRTPGFRGCQKPELDPVAGQFLSLEAGRTPVLALWGLASNLLLSTDPFFICQMVPFIRYLSCKEPWSQPLT